MLKEGLPTAVVDVDLQRAADKYVAAFIRDHENSVEKWTTIPKYTTEREKKERERQLKLQEEAEKMKKKREEAIAQRLKEKQAEQVWKKNLTDASKTK